MASHHVFDGGQLIAVPQNGRYTMGRLTQMTEIREREEGGIDRRPYESVMLFDGTVPRLTHADLERSVMIPAHVSLPKEIVQAWRTVQPSDIGAVIALREKDRHSATIYQLVRLVKAEPARTTTGTIDTFYAIETADGSYTMHDRPAAYLRDARVIPTHLSAYEAGILHDPHYSRSMSFSEDRSAAQSVEEEEEECHQFSV